MALIRCWYFSINANCHSNRLFYDPIGPQCFCSEYETWYRLKTRPLHLRAWSGFARLIGHMIGTYSKENENSLQARHPQGNNMNNTTIADHQRHTTRGSHIDVACRNICDQDQNEIKWSMFILGADQGIKTNSERLISSDQRTFSDT